MKNTGKQIRLVSMIIQETGTYARNYSRPYMTNTTDESLTELETRIGDVCRGDPIAKIGGGILSGLAGNLVIPSSAWDHEIIIPNGWDTKRFRFILQVEVDLHFGTNVYYIQGYSEDLSISMQGTFDPRMMFYINSYICINRAQDYSGLGPGGFRDVVVESAQVIDGRIHSQNSPSVYGLRPEDMFTGIQSNYTKGAYATYGEAKISDDRENRAGEVFRSTRSNGIPSGYLGRLIECHRSASTLADYGSGQADILNRSIQNSYEGTMYENPFIQALSNLTGITGTTSFTLEDLELLDPTFGSRIDRHELDETVRMSHHGDTDENWANATLETQQATIITQSVSGLMLDNMLVYAGFHCTTLTFDGRPETRVFPDTQAVSTGDMRKYVSRFITRFETEVLPDITQNGQIPVDIIVEADLYGETKVQISLDGNPHELYITPSFCDALMAPVVTTNTADYHNLIIGVEDIIHHSGALLESDNSPRIFTGI